MKLWKDLEYWLQEKTAYLPQKSLSFLHQAVARGIILEKENEGLRQKNEALHDSLAELNVLQEEAGKLATLQDEEELLAMLCRFASDYLNYEAAAIYLFKKEDFRFTFGMHMNEHFQDQVQAQIEDGIIDWVLQSGKVAVIPEIEPNNHEHHIIFPIQILEKTIGFFCLISSLAEDEITRHQLDQVAFLVSQAAISIENSRLYADLEKAHQELQRSQEAFLQSNKLAALGTLSAGIAHEMNSPLGSVALRIEMLQRRYAQDAQAQDDLASMHQDIQKLITIIQRLEAFSQLDRAQKKPVSIGTLLEEALLLMEHQFVEKAIQVDKETPNKNIHIYADATQIQQVFINVMSNAVQAMETGGLLKIRHQISTESDEIPLADQDKIVTLSFEDNGTGIDSNKISHVFEPFFTEKKEWKNLGLGLSVSYSIVQQHHGSIDVTSTKDQGTLVQIQFPIGD